MSPTRNDPSLLDMPDLVIEKILKKCGFIEIVRLRKVCSSLRNYIDDHRKEEKVNDVWIKVCPDRIEMSRNEMPAGFTVEIIYENRENGCWVEWNRNEESKKKLTKNIDYLETFLMDLKYFLSSPKLKLRNFTLDFHCWNDRSESRTLQNNIECEKGCLSILKTFFGFENKPEVEVPRDLQLEINILAKKVFNEIRDFMKTRTTPLVIEDLRINVDGEEELIDFLTYVDPRYLKRLYLLSRKHFNKYYMDKYMEHPTFDIKDHILKTDKLKQMEHWKNLKELVSDEIVFDLPIRNVTHFKRVDVALVKFSIEDVLFLKELFMNSPCSQFFKISILNSDSYKETVKAFPQLLPGIYSVHFPIPNSALELRISFKDHYRIITLVCD